MQVSRLSFSGGSVRAFGFVTTPHLAKEIRSGERGYMNRGVWPPQVLVKNEVITDTKAMRRDYVEVSQLLSEQVEKSQKEGAAYVVFRANIPMNLGTGWFTRGEWVLHPTDRIEQNSPFIYFDPISHSVYASSSFGLVSEEHGGLLTPCLGWGQFEPDLLIRTTYDPRDVVPLAYRWPKDLETWGTVRHDPNNVHLVSLAGLYELDRPRYIEEVKKEVFPDPNQPPRWGVYNRSYFVVGQKSGESFEFYVFDRGTHPEQFEEILRQTNVPGPVVFGLVSGGSFGVGVIHRGELHEVGSTVGYYRGAKGMWVGWVEVQPEEVEAILPERGRIG